MFQDCFAGRVRRNRVGVVAGAELSDSEPPFAMTSRRLRLSPMPEPCGRVVKNGVKILGAMSEGIGWPSFSISIRIVVSAIDARIAMCVAPASTAFLIRLTITCRNWSRSANRGSDTEGRETMKSGLWGLTGAMVSG